MTETASGVVAMPLGDAGRRPWSAGRALPGVELRRSRLPTARRRSRRTRADGEILVRGPMVFDGYENDPEASAAALDSEGWLHTGDLGSLDREGWLRVVARATRSSSRAARTSLPAEIEAVLASHPAVADVGVVGVADEKWGSVPVAVVASARRPRRPGDASGVRPRTSGLVQGAGPHRRSRGRSPGRRPASCSGARCLRPPAAARPGAAPRWPARRASRPTTASRSRCATCPGRRARPPSSFSTPPFRPPASCCDSPVSCGPTPASCCRIGGGAARARWRSRRRFRSPATSPIFWPSSTPPP